MACRVLILAVLIAFLPEAAQASRSLRRGTPTVTEPLQPSANGSADMVAVDVPVLVVVVDDANASAAEAPQDSGLTPSCEKEMGDLKSDPQRSQQAQQCEQKQGHAKEVLEKLTAADEAAATDMVATTFQTCGKISKSCSKEIAPQIVMMVRLSGMAISDKCKKAAQKTSEGDEKQQACQDKMMQGVLDKLQQHNLDGALERAETGLDKCVGLEKPCDFQFAPILVSQLIAAIQQRQMQEEEEQIVPILLHSLSAAAKLEAQVKPDAVPAKATPKAAAGVHKNGTKAISLLKVAERFRIESAKHSIALF